MSKTGESLKTSRRDFIKLAGVGAGVTALGVGVHSEAAAGSGTPLVANVGRVVPYRVGKWLPSDQAILDRWLARHIQAVADNPKPLHPVIQELKDLIEGDAQIYMFFHQMFDELPRTPKFRNDPTGKPQVRDYKQMLELINGILTTAPTFDKTGLVGLPINAILDWPMGTPSGFAAFLNDKVNAQFKKILNAWATFLSSPDSCYVLNDDPESGWFGRDAMAAMPNFVEEFQCEPDQPYYGFTSWDDFFTRLFRDGQRPIAAPEDDSVHRQCLRIGPIPTGARRQAVRPILDQGSALFPQAHVRRRPGLRAVCGWHGLPGLPQRAQLPPLAQPGQRNHRQVGRDRWHLLLGDTRRGIRSGRAQQLAGLHHGSGDARHHPD